MYRDGFICSLSGLVMGETAEILARERGITRADSDTFACESQRRAAVADKSGVFTREIAPVVVTDSKGRATTVDRDEHIRAGTTIESLTRLPPVFSHPDGGGGIVTAGSSSGITDGAAALVIASESWAAQRQLAPRARIVAWATVGVDPRVMGIGPVPAVRRLEHRDGVRLDDQDLVEINEAFAPQVIAVMRDLSLSSDRVNVNGGAIALGHPIGCSGARIVVTLVHEMERRNVRRGLATLCVSGGMGMAMAIERPTISD
jgi:acetyl-CoA C-acetyltransferase